jgi:hypothetical protein
VLGLGAKRYATLVAVLGANALVAACGRTDVFYRDDAYGAQGGYHALGGGSGKGGRGGKGGGVSTGGTGATGGTLSNTGGGINTGGSTNTGGTAGGGTFGFGGRVGFGMGGRGAFGGAAGRAGAAGSGFAGAAGSGPMGPFACAGVLATCDQFTSFSTADGITWGIGAFTGGISVFGSKIVRDTSDTTGIHITGTVADYGSGFVIWFTQCSSLKDFLGVIFRATGMTTLGNVMQVQLLTNSDYPWQPRPQDLKGACTSATPDNPWTDCVAPSLAVGLSSTTQAYLWSDFAGGMPVAWDPSTSPGELVGLQWLFLYDGNPYDVDVRVDTVGFMTPPDVPAVNCGSAMGGMGGMAGAAGVAGASGHAGSGGFPNGGATNTGGISGQSGFGGAGIGGQSGFAGAGIGGISGATGGSGLGGLSGFAGTSTAGGAGT